MSIQLTSQQSIDELLAAVKKFKRTGQKISEMVRGQRLTEAVVLLNEEDDNIVLIQKMLKKYEEGYLNPDMMKRIMMIRRQFKQERDRVAREMHRGRESVKQKAAQLPEEQEEQISGFDFDVESRLIRQKGDSLLNVHKKFSEIQSVVDQTHQMTLKQGQNLDLVSDSLQNTKENVSASNAHLQQANKYSKQGSRCYWWLLLVSLVLACMVCIFLFLLCLFLQLIDRMWNIFFLFIK